MINHQERVYNLIKDHIKPRAMGVPFGLAVTPVIAPMTGPDGKSIAGFGPGWDLRLTVQAGPKLIGAQDDEDVIAYMVIPGVLPPDMVFRQFAEQAINDALNERARRTAVIQT